MARDESQRPDADHSIESAVLDGVNIAEILPDSELFAQPVSSDLPQQQIFAGDVDVELFKPADPADPVDNKPVEKPQSPPLPSSASSAPSFVTSDSATPKRSSFFQKIVAISLVLIAVMLIYGVVVLSLMRPDGLSELLPQPVAKEQQQPQPVKTMTPEESEQQKTEELAAAEDDGQPVSLRIADNFYLSGDYSQATIAYKKLIGKVSVNAKDEILKDFLRLRMALCLKETKGPVQSIGQLKSAAKSTSPIVRVMANYYISRFEMDRNQYLTTRNRAYEALALVETLESNQPWVQELRRNCYFLIAASISSEVLSFSDADKKMPENIWQTLDFEDDPFAGVDDEDRLRTLLMTGSEKLSRALLGPRIEAETSENIRHWSITSDGASVDELLNRFAANAGYDVFWSPGANKAGIRQRPVSMYLSEATDEHAAEVIAGCVGLMANLNENKVLKIVNLTEYDYVSDQIVLLGKEGISLWRQFLLAFHEDRYLANVHFALGLLYAQQDQAVEALAEYKVVANRFQHSPLAPSALLNSGRLKASLRDYTSAHKDFKQLVEQYPDCSVTSEAHLALAEMADKTGSQDEAAKLYRKIYYLNVSIDSQAAAALAAAEIYYKTDDFPAAQKWLTQYLELKQDDPDKNLYRAYYLLGKSRLQMGKTEAACNALLKAVNGHLSNHEYVDAISALVEGCIELEQFVVAFDVLEDTYLSQFSQEESARLMILKSRLLRSMGLVEKAVILLRDRQNYILDPELKTEMGFELSLCYIQQGQLELAFKKLAQNLEESSPGPIAHRSGIQLAQVCMQLGRDDQAQAVCTQIVKTNPSDEIKQQALKILADIHGKQKNYENAALALIGYVQ